MSKKILSFLMLCLVLAFMSACSNIYKYQPQSKEELKALVENPQTNLSTIDTSKITDMSELFYQSKRKDFSGIEKWNTSLVTNMQSMFKNARNFNQNINSWNVSKVENMNRMFEYAVNFNQPLDKWDTSSVTDMGSMFQGATSFNQDLDKWDTSKVVDMARMFLFTKSFNKDLNEWNTSKVKYMYYMFDDSPLAKNPPKWYKEWLKKIETSQEE